MRRHLSDYYDITDDDIRLAAGELPVDIIDILRRNPQLIERLRSQYGKSD